MRGLMKKNLEDLGRRKVQRFAGQEHLATYLAVSEPSAAPPMTQLDQATTLDPGPKDEHDVGNLRVARLDGPLGQLTGRDQLARGGRQAR